MVGGACPQSTCKSRFGSRCARLRVSEASILLRIVRRDALVRIRFLSWSLSARLQPDNALFRHARQRMSEDWHMATLEELLEQVQDIARRENRPVEDVLLTMIRHYESPASDPVMRAFRQKLYAKARRYWP